MKDQNLPIKTDSEVENIVRNIKSKPGVITKSKQAQKRPRCFQKEKISKLYGTYTGPIVKGSKNGDGVFLWYLIITEGGWLHDGGYMER